MAVGRATAGAVGGRSACTWLVGSLSLVGDMPVVGGPCSLVGLISFIGVAVFPDVQAASTKIRATSQVVWTIRFIKISPFLQMIGVTSRA